MPGLASIDRDAWWQLIGRSMAAASSRAPGLISRFAPGAWQVTCEVDAWTANWLVCHRVDPTSRRLFTAGLDEAVAHGRTTSVVVTGEVRDRITPLFVDRPMTLMGLPPMMWRDASPLPANPRFYPGTITRMAAGPELRAVLDLAADAFEVDREGVQRTWLGVLDNPAMRLFTGASDDLDSLCLTWSEGNLTYIYLMATASGRQRRGAGRAVLTHAMQAAIADDTTDFCLMSSSAGEALYLALGYQTYETPEFWLVNPPPEAQVAAE